MSDRIRRAAQIAAEVFEQPTEARREFIAEACDDDDALRAEVEGLLAADAEAGSFLDRPAVRSHASPWAAWVSSTAPSRSTRDGRWR